MSFENPLYNRLVKNNKKLSHWARESQIEAYRLYKKDIPEFPYLIDLYKDHCVIYEQGIYIDGDSELHELRRDHLELTRQSLMKLLDFPNDNLIFKSRIKDKGGEQYGKINEESKILNIQEGPLKFEVNLTQYLDTGLFLDHRPLRKRLWKDSKNLKVLNLFSYTGSLSVAAAFGGAKIVTSVDLSNTYQTWAKKNFLLNGLNPEHHSFQVGDCLEILASMKKNKNIYDLILLDPPTFSNSKKMIEDFEVEKDHEKLIQICMSILNPEGLLIFSTNKRKFKISPEIQEEFQIKDWTKPSIPLDFDGMNIHQCFEIKEKKAADKQRL